MTSRPASCTSRVMVTPVAVLALVAGTLVGCRAAADPPEASPPRAVATAPADPAVHPAPTASVPTPLMISGTLEPQRRAVLRAELAGPVSRLTVRVGDAVASGALVASLDVPAARVALAAAEAQVAAAQGQQRQAERERARVAQLLAAGGASRAELEDLDARADAAAATLAAARAQVAAASTDVDRTTLRAPFAGVVEHRAATAGSMVQAGDEVLTIVDPRALELEGSVALAQAAYARVGTRVAVRVTGWPDADLTGRVVRVAPTLDPVTRQLRVTIALPNANGRLPVGAWAEASLLSPSSTPTTTPPGR